MFYNARSYSPISYIQQSPRLLKIVTFVISFILIGFVFATPTFAKGLEATKHYYKHYEENSPARMQSYVDRAVEIVEKLRGQNNEKTARKLSSALEELLGKIEQEDAIAKKQFQKMLDDVEAKHLPDIFKTRIVKMQERYEQRKDKLLEAMKALIAEHTGSIFTKWYYRLFGDVKAEDINASIYRDDTKQQFDPNQMPFELRKTKPSKPKVRQEEFISQGLFNQPLPHYAALGDFDYSTLASANDPAYLDPTDEVVITQAIKDKAAELDYDPVKIYNYVRNNIEFVPTWGAVQNAELTLGAKRGNAMDIASLLIALFRASKIPARYVHGTIELPEEKVRNWFGGWQDIDAALTFAYSNGLPNVGIKEAGRIKYVQMEHIWVEVAADYFPSRGAVNRKADAWVPLDAAYKQYAFYEGTDALSASGVDINATLQDFIGSAEINESEGYVKGMDSAIIEDMLTQAQANLEANITAELADNNTSLIEVVGGKKIVSQESATLPNTLPGKVIVVGARYAELPSSLQQKVTYYLEPLTQEAAIDEMLNGRKTVTLPYAKVNNQKVTLSYAPATQADQDALEALLPQGEITDVSQLPSTLPSYIHVKPQIKLNGEVILEGGEMRLGDKINIDQAVQPVNASSTGFKKHKSHAGDYLALGTVAQSVSPAILKKLQNRMNEIKSILESGDKTEIAKLNREDVMGNMHYATMLGYYAQLLGQTKMLQHTSKVREIIIGFGTFGSEVGIASRFGLPTGIKAGGIGLDIPISKVIVADNNNRRNFLNYRLQAGMIASSLEHQTPEQMYNTDPSKPVQGISTMKALALANAEGQKIYTITQDNIAQVLPKIQASSLVKGDIQSAVNAGKTVTVHEKEVSVPGWSGTGYMVIDPTNGNGAFLIGGGGNGSWASTTQALLLNLILDLEHNGVKLRPAMASVISTIGVIVSILDRIQRCSHGLGLAVMLLLTVFMAQISAVVVLLTALTFASTFLTGLAIVSMATIIGVVNLEMDRYCE